MASETGSPARRVLADILSAVCFSGDVEQSVGASRLLRYDANGSTESAAGYNSVSWRSVAP